jgi:hypothetical protein
MVKVKDLDYFEKTKVVSIDIDDVDRNTLRKILDFLDEMEGKVTKVKEETPKTEEKPKPLPERKEIPVEKTKAVKKPENESQKTGGRPKIDREPIRALIVDFLRNNPESTASMVKAEIEKKFDLGDTTIQKMIKELENDGTIFMSSGYSETGSIKWKLTKPDKKYEVKTIDTDLLKSLFDKKTSSFEKTISQFELEKEGIVKETDLDFIIKLRDDDIYKQEIEDFVGYFFDIDRGIIPMIFITGIKEVVV